MYMLIIIRSQPASFIKATVVRPSCWNVLTHQCDVLVAVDNKLYLLDQFEAIPQVYYTHVYTVYVCTIYIHVHVYIVHIRNYLHVL